MPVIIEVRNGQVITNLRRIVRELNNPGPALKITGQLAVRAVQRNFAAQRDPQGKPWARLSAATIERRRNKKKSSIRILIDTGRLRNSINYQSDSKEARVGTNVLYAPFHNFGTRRMPQREFMGVTSEDETGIVNALNAYVKRVVSQSGLK